MENETPIINCHTHVFISEILPPYLAKTFAVWPLYLIRTNFIIKTIAWIYDYDHGLAAIPRRKWYKQLYRRRYLYRAFIRRHALIWWPVLIINNLLIVNVFYFFFRKQIYTLLGFWTQLRDCVVELKDLLIEYHLLWTNLPFYVEVLLLIFVLFFLKNGRKLVFSLLKNTIKFLSLLPNKKTLDFLKRYLYIGRFATYSDSRFIFYKLQHQYDHGTGFVLLPMDLEFMGAGPLSGKDNYRRQLAQLAFIKTKHKDTAFPFLFVDPRRIETEKKSFFDYTLNPGTGEVTLKDCLVKQYLVTNAFSGIKIYPALGYYPFDENLLILWKYAADNGIPIMTHAIRGTIFYRGKKKKDWNFHPVFQQYTSLDDRTPEPLLLPQLRNIDFINNFTHPLNYLCLLEPKALWHVLNNSQNQEIKDFFGFRKDNDTLRHNLRELKICFGHYGGEDEWNRYLEADRNVYAAQITMHPGRGIDFLDNNQTTFNPAKLGDIWHRADWYSIITSLILQYPNLYADISYIVHDQEIIPLLKNSLQVDKLKDRILFGTDFYVVRNHKSEKEILGELMTSLSPEEFDLIARINPRNYLR